MIHINSSPQWRVVGASVRGAMHERNGKGNQDATGWAPHDGVGPALVVAVSDGHGSHKSFRSDRGSKIAVAIAKKLLSEITQAGEETLSLSALKHMAENRLPQALAQEWHQAVSEDSSKDAFSKNELDSLEGTDGPVARQAVLEHPHIAYGATLLAVLITSRFILYLQIGDGDILTTSAGGVTTRPLPADKRLLANETTSLSSKDAWRDFRVHFQPVGKEPPALITLSTDGYANSFDSEAGFLAVGPDILERARAEGMGVVQDRLGGWLDAATRQGSGDDVTLAIIKRSEDRDTDSILARLAECERAAEQHALHAVHIDRLECEADTQAASLKLLMNQVCEQKTVVRRLRRWLLATLALAILAIFLPFLTSVRDHCRSSDQIDVRSERTGVARAPSRPVGPAAPSADVGQP